MLKRAISVSVLAGALAVLAGPLFAADQIRDQTQDMAQKKDKVQKQAPIYGSQLMTQKERNAYRAKMRAAKTAKERKNIRLKHHKIMQMRANERGVSLPDMPPAADGRMMPQGGGN